MTKGQDAYGGELIAAYKGGAVFEIIERDDGFIAASYWPHDTFPTIGNGRGESGKRCGSPKGGSSMLAAVREGLPSICREKATT